MMRHFVFLLSLVIIFSSCNILDHTRIKGNGKIISKNYDLKNFSSIDIGGAKSIYIKQDSMYSVRVETDENLMELLNVQVNGSELEASVEGRYWLSPSDKIKIYISLPVLRKLNISGASDVRTENKFSQDEKLDIDISGASEGTLTVRSPDIKIKASGASILTIDGGSRTVNANVSGASTLNAYDLKAENTTTKASGASTANVFASIQLNANANGASNVRYKGNPNVTQKSSGASDVKKENP